MPPPAPPFCYKTEDNLFVSHEKPQEDFPDHLDVWSFVCEHKSHHRSPPSRDQVWFLEPDGRQTTFGQVQDRVESLARALKAEVGLEEEDVVAIFSPNCVHWAIACWAAHRNGCVVSPANPTYSAEELAYQLKLVLEHRSIKALFVHPASADAGLKAAEQLGLPKERVFALADGCKGLQTVEDLIKKHPNAAAIKRKPWAKGESQKRLALISASSGTTGLPKIIAIPHYSITTNVMQTSQHFRGFFKPGQDRPLGVMPFYHIYGFIVVLHCAVYESMPLGVIAKFTFESVLQAIANLKLTLLWLVPPIVTLMVKNPIVDKYDLSHCRAAMVGAAPLGDDVFKAFLRKFPHMMFGQGYGMSETSTMVFGFPWNRDSSLSPGASCGVLFNGITVKIINPETGEKLGYDQRGELCIKTPARAMCYLGNEKATAETFVDGYVHSGDEAYVNKEGYFFITDRLKELIKHKGLQVAPAELEDHILSHPDVADVAVIGIPDSYAGELPRAYCVLTEQAGKRCSGNQQESTKTKEAIKKFVADAKAASKHLAGGVEFIDAVPKNPSGKLLRRILRDKARQEIAQGQQAKL